MSITTSAQFNSDTLQGALPAGASFSTVGGPLTTATPKTVTFYGTDDTTGQAAVTTAAGQYVDRAANRASIQAQAQQALAANANDLTQDASMITQAGTITSTTGTLTTAQLSNFVRLLAQGVALLAGHDQNTKAELNALIRLVLGQFDATT